MSFERVCHGLTSCKLTCHCALGWNVLGIFLLLICMQRSSFIRLRILGDSAGGVSSSYTSTTVRHEKSQKMCLSYTPSDYSLYCSELRVQMGSLRSRAAVEFVGGVGKENRAQQTGHSTRWICVEARSEFVGGVGTEIRFRRAGHLNGKICVGAAPCTWPASLRKLFADFPGA